MLNNKHTDFKVLIAGGGIGGLTLGILLERAGIPCQIFEKIPVQKRVGSSMGIWPNATRILREMDVLDSVASRGVDVKLIESADHQGEPLQTIEVQKLEDPALFIHRADFIQALLSHVSPKIFQSGRALERFEHSGQGVRVFLSDGSEVNGNVLIGADGLRSRVREILFGESKPLYLGYVAYYGTVDLAHESLIQGSVKIRFGNGLRFMTSPLRGKSVEWTAIVNTHESEKDVKDSQASRKQNLLEMYSDWEAPVLKLMSETEQIEATAIHDRTPIKNWGQGAVSLLGDAAHPTAPELALGACMAIEDAFVLSRVLIQAIENDRPPAPALRQYEAQRFNRTRLVTLGSEIVGKLGQSDNPLLTALGNTIVRSIPTGLVNTVYNQILKALSRSEI